MQKEIIAFVNAEKGIALAGVGSVKSADGKGVELEIEETIQKMGWGKLKNTEYSNLIIQTAEGRTGLSAEFYLGASRSVKDPEYAEKYLAKALSLNAQITDTYLADEQVGGDLLATRNLQPATEFDWQQLHAEVT